MIRVEAPAKVNLFLHVGPVRADGLHEIFSLFFFAGGGDVIAAALAETLSLDVAGPFAAALENLPLEENLVWRAAEKLREAVGINQGAAITLEKNLPIAAGIGGGSADAAAALRALNRMWGAGASDAALAALAFELGADVPACLAGAPVIVSGAGEKVSAGPSLPPLFICLANPGVETPTGPVFRAFDAANPTPAAPCGSVPAAIEAYDDLVRFMNATRNDLEPHAVAAAPVIGEAVALLAASPGVLGARMSGSGATAFGLYRSLEYAENAARLARAEGWWSIAAPVLAGRE